MYKLLNYPACRKYATISEEVAYLTARPLYLKIVFYQTSTPNGVHIFELQHINQYKILIIKAVAFY
ncbi:hypothetical protein D0T49_08200 [Paludibacter sp. 221]|nr:hypothetical protein [Paludibacter sp. 221]